MENRKLHISRTQDSKPTLTLMHLQKVKQVGEKRVDIRFQALVHVQNIFERKMENVPRQMPLAKSLQQSKIMRHIGDADRIVEADF